MFPAQSCPPIRVYSADKLDKQLAMAAASFCGQEIDVNPEGKVSSPTRCLKFWIVKDGP